MKNYIGTLLSFDEKNYEKTIAKYKPLLHAVDVVGEHYESLDTSFKFTQEVFEDIVANKASNIKGQYDVVIEQQIEQSKFTSKAIVNNIKQSAVIEICEFEKVINGMFETQQKAAAPEYLVSQQKDTIYPVDFKYIRIIDGKAELPEEYKAQIKEAFEIKINTSKQNEFYNRLLSVQKEYEGLTTFLVNEGFDLNNTVIISDTVQRCLLSEVDGKLTIEPETITLV
jgi:hypothetical protein